jgi:hypothetical protein
LISLAISLSFASVIHPILIFMNSTFACSLSLVRYLSHIFHISFFSSSSHLFVPRLKIDCKFWLCWNNQESRSSLVHASRVLARFATTHQFSWKGDLGSWNIAAVRVKEAENREGICCDLKSPWLSCQWWCGSLPCAHRATKAKASVAGFMWTKPFGSSPFLFAICF